MSLKTSFMIFLFVLSGLVHSNDSLKKANKLYLEGNYKDSIKEYSAILKSQGDLGEVHFNLGNAYFRNNEKGRALYHFRKASEVLPRDGDVKYNLQYLREKTIDKVESRSFLNGYNLFPFNKRETSLMLLICWGIFWLFSLALLMMKREAVKWMRNLSFFICLFFSVPFINGLWDDDFGVVGAEKTSVYSGIGKDNVKLFVLHEGTEVVLKDIHQNGWVRIEVDQAKKGWMKKEDLIF